MKKAAIFFGILFFILFSSLTGQISEEFNGTSYRDGGYHSPINDSRPDILFRSAGLVEAYISQPVDINGDGRIVTTCNDQQIIWIIRHEMPIDPSSIRVLVDERSYRITSPYLTFTADSVLTFTPHEDSLWETIFDGGGLERDSIRFCLSNVIDTSGDRIASPLCEWFFLDLAAPEIFRSEPAHMSVIHTEDCSVDLSFYDNICDYDDIDINHSRIDIFSSGLLRDSYDDVDFPYDLSLINNDSIVVFSITRQLH